MLRYKDGKNRCRWANPNNDRYIQYHDCEWGRPVHEDCHLFEMLILESFQAGLSWECVLNKRDSFRAAFDQFDLNRVCAYGEEKIEELMQNKDIIRNRRKITAAVKNAQIFKKMQKEFGSFSHYIWSFTGDQVIYENDKTSSDLSDKISQDLYKRGMRFVGTTIIYSFLQAVGVIYSHEDDCFLCYRDRRKE